MGVYPATVLGFVAGLIATVFGTGRSPIAPGTVASALALLAYVLTPLDGSSPALYALVGGGFVTGVWASGRLAARLGEHDPKQVVADEVVGLWAACLWLPKEAWWLAGAFVLFRALDIIKPWPLRSIERLPGGVGVMADDVAAGLIAAGLLAGLRAIIG